MNETDGDCAVCMAACRLSCGAPVKPAGDFMSLLIVLKRAVLILCFILNLLMHPAVFFIVVIVIYKQLMQQLTLCNLIIWISCLCMRIDVFLYLEYFSFQMETHSVFVDAVL